MYYINNLTSYSLLTLQYKNKVSHAVIITLWYLPIPLPDHRK